MTTCRDLTAFLAEYVGGELDAAIRDNFEAHIARCPDCVVFIAQYRRTIQVSHAAFDEVQHEPLPEGLVKAIVQAMKKA
jgi:anti-sigma factor RsiW